MRKINWFNMMTLDGYFAGENGDISWHNVDEEFIDFANEQNQSNSADLFLFGRKTYDVMASYWPTTMAKENDPITADYMNNTQKYVFSKSMKSAEWNKTSLFHEINIKDITELKNQPGKNIMVFGSAEIASVLIKFNLIDEYSVMINPVVLGKGQPLFKDIPERFDLRLISTRQFKSGNILLNYERK